MNEAQITFTGNATADADLKFTQSGHAVANVSVAVTPREKVDGEWVDGQPAFYRVAAWRQLGENVAESVRRGDRVTVVGRLRPREFEHNGEKRLSLDVDADSVALDLRFRTASAGPKGQRQPAQQGQDDPWGQPEAQPQGSGWGGPPPQASGYSSEPPF